MSKNEDQLKLSDLIDINLLQKLQDNFAKVIMGSSDALVNRENKLAMIYKSSMSSENLIKESIENNSFYQK